MPTPTDFERRHLVVELKRPSQPVNEDIISQVKKYAKAVATDDRFKATGVEWDFIALSNSLTRDAEIETWQTGKPRGLVAEYDDPRIRVWAKTSGQIISEAEGRLTFYKRRLEYKADDVEALRYLRTVDPNYLSEEVGENCGAGWRRRWPNQQAAMQALGLRDRRGTSRFGWHQRTDHKRQGHALQTLKVGGLAAGRPIGSQTLQLELCLRL